MIRHCVLLTLTDDAPAGQAETIVSQLRTLPGLIPAIASYRAGVDLGLADGNASIAVVGDFETEADYNTYATHPDHVAMIAEHIRPFAAGRTAVQFELD